MKLSKALKEKNRLVGEVNRLRAIISRENSRESRNTSKVDVGATIAELTSTVERLSKLKTAIAKANVGIYEAIEKMSELKSHATWIATLDTRDGAEETSGYGSVVIKKEYTAHVKKEDIDKLTKEIQDQLGVLQDKVDEYNATTEVVL